MYNTLEKNKIVTSKYLFLDFYWQNRYFRKQKQQLPSPKKPVILMLLSPISTKKVTTGLGNKAQLHLWRSQN